MDLHKSFDDGRSYFLGSIVLSQDGADSARKAVLDGQQRLATTCILLAAISGSLRQKRGNRLRVVLIAQDYIGRFDRDAGSNLPNLILSTEDRHFFERVVMNREAGVVPLGESQERIDEAYKRLTNDVKTFCDIAGALWKEKLDRSEIPDR